MYTYISKSEIETIELGKTVGKKLFSGAVLALDAPLASGKTYFTKGIALGLGITQDITSPTFTIINEYDGGRLYLYHVDAYRLSSAEDFYNIGCDDMLFGEGVTIIEWASIVQETLPKDTIYVSIEVKDDGSRLFCFTGDLCKTLFL